jgi:hypothetical protein
MRKSECGLRKDGIAPLNLLLKQTDYIHSTFDVRCSLVSFSIRLDARGQASLFRDYGLCHYLYNMPLLGYDTNKSEGSAAFIFVLVPGAGWNIGI